MGTKIVLIGAGSAQFGFGTLADTFASPKLVGSTVVLHDINPQALDHVFQAARAYVQEKALPTSLAATTSRQEALQGADFCIIAIEVQVAVHDLTAEAVLTGSKAVALQALLVDPVVHSLRSAEQTLDTILDLQQPYLDYIR